MAVSAFFSACGGSNPTGPTSVGPNGQALPVLSGTVAGNTVTVPVVAGGPLDAPGGLALVSASILPGSFLVARTTAVDFNVLTAICTHQGCTVDLYTGQQFVCPCHGSTYTTAGAVVNGPATVPLRSYPSVFGNGMLTFTV